MIKFDKKVTIYLLIGAILSGTGLSILEAAPKKDDKQQHEQQRHMEQQRKNNMSNNAKSSNNVKTSAMINAMINVKINCVVKNSDGKNIASNRNSGNG